MRWKTFWRLLISKIQATITVSKQVEDQRPLMFVYLNWEFICVKLVLHAATGRLSIRSLFWSLNYRRQRTNDEIYLICVLYFAQGRDGFTWRELWKAIYLFFYGQPFAELWSYCQARWFRHQHRHPFIDSIILRPRAFFHFQCWWTEPSYEPKLGKVRLIMLTLLLLMAISMILFILLTRKMVFIGSIGQPLIQHITIWRLWCQFIKSDRSHKHFKQSLVMT